MKVIPDTDKNGFEAYIEKVTKSGYDLYTRNEIGDNSFATLTTDGYKQAIKRAFDAMNILKGGN